MTLARSLLGSLSGLFKRTQGEDSSAPATASDIDRQRNILRHVRAYRLWRSGLGRRRGAKNFREVLDAAPLPPVGGGFKDQFLVAGIAFKHILDELQIVLESGILPENLMNSELAVSQPGDMYWISLAEIRNQRALTLSEACHVIIQAPESFLVPGKPWQILGTVDISTGRTVTIERQRFLNGKLVVRLGERIACTDRVQRVPLSDLSDVVAA